MTQPMTAARGSGVGITSDQPALPRHLWLFFFVHKIDRFSQLMAGRPAKPPALKVLTGRGDGKDSAGRPIPVTPNFTREAPDPPEWLSEEARAEWNRVVPELETLDLLKPADRAMLIAYCETWDLYMTAVLKVRAEGMTIINPESGLERKHPVLSVLMESAAQLRTFAREFGLTPSAEHAISKAPASGTSDEADPFTGQTASA